MLRSKAGWRMLAAAVLASVTIGVMPQVWAATTFKTIHRFTGGKDGGASLSDLIIDGEGNLYGTTVSGGAHDKGTVFKMTPQSDGSWSETVLYNFCSLGWTCPDGWGPFGGVIFDQEGNLYGSTGHGGDGQTGVVFRLTHNPDDSWTEEVLYSFQASRDGAFPIGDLTFDQTGSLYGATSDGGEGSEGAIFRLVPNSDGTWTETVLYSFCALKACRDGGRPAGSLVFGQMGNLYGTTTQGGPINVCNSGCGVVFQLTPNPDGSWTQSVLHAFRGGRDGYYPEAGLIFDGSGNLFGTTFWGGAHPFGTVFELVPNQGSWKKNILHSFTGGKDGSAPAARLTFDVTGNLYGTTIQGGDAKSCEFNGGCGVVFKLTPNANGKWPETELHRFHNTPGSHAFAGVVFDAAGNLYGATAGDGVLSVGSVYEITP